MNSLNQKKYWLDIHREPTTLYVITEERLTSKSTEPLLSGCVINQHIEELPPELTFQQLLNELRQAANSLWQHPWRPSALLLLVISSLSIYRLYCLHSAAH
jgi:hypothetical protein